MKNGFAIASLNEKDDGAVIILSVLGDRSDFRMKLEPAPVSMNGCITLDCF